MNRYEIYCTTEQTAKAIKLGALIKWSHNRFEDDEFDPIGPDTYAVIPTASQMVGWLEEQRLFIHIDYDFHANDKPYKCEMCLLNGLTRHCGWFTSREEATIAAIDAALNHLIQH